MSHYSVLAVGFYNVDDVKTALEKYDQTVCVEPHVLMTKQQLLEENEKDKQILIKKIKLYRSDAEAARREYGDFIGEHMPAYEAQLQNYNDPEYLYKLYASEYGTDANGNVITTDNPDGKYDYYTIEETSTISKLKQQRDKHIKLFEDESMYRRLWSIIVDGDKASGAECIAMLLSPPNRSDLLSTYGDLNTYLNARRNNFYATYAVLTPDGWHEPGRVGALASSSASCADKNKFRESYFSRFIEPYPDDMQVWIIDCHT